MSSAREGRKVKGETEGEGRLPQARPWTWEETPGLVAQGQEDRIPGWTCPRPESECPRGDSGPSK